MVPREHMDDTAIVHIVPVPRPRTETELECLFSYRTAQAVFIFFSIVPGVTGWKKTKYLVLARQALKE